MTSVHSNASLCNDCDHTVFVSSMFTLSVTEMNSEPNIVSHYEQVYRSQKVCISGPMCNCPFSCCDMYYYLSQYWTLVFSYYEQVYRTQKVCVSGPMFIGLSFLVLVSTTTSQNIHHFFNTLYMTFIHDHAHNVTYTYICI